jgi:hypothetical protein
MALMAEEETVVVVTWMIRSVRVEEMLGLSSVSPW